MRVRISSVRRAAVMLLPLCALVVLALALGCQQDPTLQAIDGLKSSSAAERLQAIQVLAQAADARLEKGVIEQVEAALGQALADTDEQVSLKAAEACVNWRGKQLHPTEAAVALTSLVASDSATLQRSAVGLLGKLRNDAATAGLARALAQDATTRITAAKALEARNATLGADDEVRLQLVLGRPEQVAARGASAIPALQTLLDEDTAYRAAAATAIVLIDDADAIAVAVGKVLVDLESDDVAVRLAAVGALGALGDDEAISPLQNLAANDPDMTVQSSARVAAHVVMGDTVALLGTLDDADVHVQTVTVRGLRNVDDKRPAVDPLIRLVRRTTNQDLANEAITTLASCGALAAVPLLTHIAEEPEWGLRLRLAKALGQPTVVEGMDQDTQAVLYDLYIAEVNDNVKAELNRILNDIPEA